ncbi:hypothetical protein ACFIQF_11645 [Comamonas sp. J-3]|uniref:hypothetical protein n=1 Tax=Comamonas trifloxystrobinivorans TaxID=3350256 RepID=UPI00372C5B04
MPAYALINADAICYGIANYDAALDPQPSYAIAIADGADTMGQRWTGKKWVAAATADQRPLIVVENIKPNAEHNAVTIVADNMEEVRTLVGAVLTLTVRIEVGGVLYPANEAFDMPISSVDGRVYPKRVLFEKGRATFDIALTEPRIWQVSEAMVNSGLPPERHMRFAGLRVVAAEM